VFDRDSIEWGHASTVGDLLLQVPGVYLWRGGFVGRPEPVNYQGRGATSAEYYLDGLPYVATGVDSVAVDPALFSLSFLDRIEVERWPGLLRVHLVTRRHDRRAPRSRIGIADQAALALRGELHRVARDVLEILVLRDRPVAGAVRHVLPEHGGFAAQHLEHLVRTAALEGVEVVQVHFGELHRRVLLVS